jgi:hypothetical protein
MTLSKPEYSAVVYKITEALDIAKSESLIRNVIAFCNRKQIPSLRSKYQDIHSLTDYLANLYIKQISQIDEPEESHIDLKQIKLEAKTIATTPEAKTVSVYIDSRYRDKTMYSPDTMIRQFDYSIAENSGSTRIPGQISVNGRLSNVSSFEIVKIILPYKQSYQRLNPLRNINLSFLNLSANAIINPVSTHHFSFDYDIASYNTDMVVLNPKSNSREFKFNPPLRTLDQLRIQFLDPYEPIQFEADVLEVDSVYYTFVDGRIQFSKDHGLKTGDVIRISKFSTLNSTNNTHKEIVKQIHNSRGISITVLNSNTISTGIDFSQIADIADHDNNNPEIEVLSRGFRFELKINYTSSDNY